MRLTISVSNAFLGAIMVTLDPSQHFFCHGLTTSTLRNNVVSFQPHHQPLRRSHRSTISSSSSTARGLKIFGFGGDNTNKKKAQDGQDKNDNDKMVYPNVDLSSVLAKRIGQYLADDEEGVQDDVDKQLTYLDKEIAFVEASSFAFDLVDIDDQKLWDAQIVATKILQEIYEARHASKKMDGGTKDLVPETFEVLKSTQQYIEEQEEGEVEKNLVNTKETRKTPEKKTARQFWNVFGNNSTASAAAKK